MVPFFCSMCNLGGHTKNMQNKQIYKQKNNKQKQTFVIGLVYIGVKRYPCCPGTIMPRGAVKGPPSLNGDVEDGGTPEDDFSDERLREVSWVCKWTGMFWGKNKQQQQKAHTHLVLYERLLKKEWLWNIWQYLHVCSFKTMCFWQEVFWWSLAVTLFRGPMYSLFS